MSTPGPGHHHGGNDHADWEERYAGDAPVWSGRPNQALVEELADLTPSRALDVGCGEGADAIWLARQGWQVTAVDVASNALERARAAGRSADVAVRWVAGGLADLPDRDEAFDLVSCFYPALRRTADGDAEAALLGSVAPGGTLLVVHHADIDGEVALAHGFDPDDYVGHQHVVAALDDSWEIERDAVRERDLVEGPGAHHHRDLVLRARRRP
jgi:SAM-dependent methyltransferase